MTSTEHISNLIDSYTDLKSYFEGIRGRIDADLAAAEKRVGDAFRRFYVDQAKGDDAADGSEAAPLRTIQEAASRSVHGGVLQIDLMSDYHLDQTAHFRRGDVRISSSDGSINRRISFATQNPFESNFSPRFSHPFSLGSFHFANITFVSRKKTEDPPHQHMIATHGLTVTTFGSCEFEVPAGADMPVFQWAHGFGFTVQDTVYPTEMAGLWVERVGVGTDPTTFSRLAFTNLTSL